MTPTLFELIACATREARPAMSAPALTYDPHCRSWIAFVGVACGNTQRFVRPTSEREPEHLTIRRVLCDVGDWLLSGPLAGSTSHAAVALRIELTGCEVAS